MKKISIILLSVFFILCTNAKVQAQFIKIGVGGGLTNITGPDELTKDVSEGGLGFSTEYNLAAIGKINLPLIPLTPRALVIYNKLSGDGSSEIPLNKGTNVTSINYEFSQSILSLGVGVQYGFIPIPVGIDPYLSVDLMFNNFGDFTITEDGIETTENGISRTGLQFGLGAEVSIIPSINLDVFAGYHLFNMFGKDEGEETIRAINLDLFLMFNFL